MSLPGVVVAVRELFAGFLGTSLKWQHIRFRFTEGSRDLLGHRALLCQCFFWSPWMPQPRKGAIRSDARPQLVYCFSGWSSHLLMLWDRVPPET